MDNAVFVLAARRLYFKFIHAVVMIDSNCGVAIVDGCREFIAPGVQWQSVDPVVYIAFAFQVIDMESFCD